MGRGTCFTIYVPHVVAAPDTREASPGIGRTHGAETVLIVEDVIGLRRLITRILESAGFKVLSAASGDEAMRLLEQYDEAVHLMVTDVVMPGISGRTLAERLDELRPEMKVLFMSGYTDDVVVRHGVSQGEMRFISKPFGTMEFVRTIREVLDAPPQASS
jgi:DNA-binding NtrC family response regulator